MQILIQFLAHFETPVYILLGITGLFFIRKLIYAWRDYHEAVFGLEKENSTHRIGSSIAALVILIILSVGEFFLATYLYPGMPKAKVLNTPTIDLLATATTTLSPGKTTPQTQPAKTQLPGVSGSGTPAPVMAAAGPNGCVKGKIEWLAPGDGEEISGAVLLKGTIQAENFSFFKYDYAPIGSETWMTIAASAVMVKENDIGTWNTMQVDPGEYRLRLVVYDNRNTALPACIINVKILPR